MVDNEIEPRAGFHNILPNSAVAACRETKRDFPLRYVTSLSGFFNGSSNLFSPHLASNGICGSLATTSKHGCGVRCERGKRQAKSRNKSTHFSLPLCVSAFFSSDNNCFLDRRQGYKAFTQPRQPSVDADNTQTFRWFAHWSRWRFGSIGVNNPPFAFEPIEKTLRYSFCHACPPKAVDATWKHLIGLTANRLAQ